MNSSKLSRTCLIDWLEMWKWSTAAVQLFKNPSWQLLLRKRKTQTTYQHWRGKRQLKIQKKTVRFVLVKKKNKINYDLTTMSLLLILVPCLWSRHTEPSCRLCWLTCRKRRFTTGPTHFLTHTHEGIHRHSFVLNSPLFLSGDFSQFL